MARSAASGANDSKMRLTSSAASGGFAATAQPNLSDAVRSTRASGASFANTSFWSRSCSAVFSPDASARVFSRHRGFCAARAGIEDLTRVIV